MPYTYIETYCSVIRCVQNYIIPPIRKSEILVHSSGMVGKNLKKYKESYLVHIVGRLYLITGRRMDYCVTCYAVWISYL